MNLAPFNNPTSMNCGPFHIIMGAMPKHWKPDIEARRLLQIVDNESIRRFLPSLALTTDREAEEWIKGLSMGYILQTNLPIILRLNDPLATVGYVMCHSPAYYQNADSNDDNYDGWSIEFFLDEPIWGKGWMSVALQNVLAHLQESHANRVRASTHKDNHAPIRILEKLGLRRIGFSGEKGEYVVHEVRLNS